MPLTAHFLNVGEGDCTILEHRDNGRISVIDLSNIRTLDETTIAETLETTAGANLTLVREAAARAVAPLTDALDYFDANIGRSQDIWRLVITHPHMDHISGLHRLITQEPKSVYNFWHSSYENFDLDDDDKWDASMGRYNRDDWRMYKHIRDSGNYRTFDQRRGRVNSFWKEDGIEIWAPTDDLVVTAANNNNQNILSMVLKVTYAGRTILLGGDATAEDTWPAIYPHTDMTGIDVLKASHHGRNSGYHQPSVKEMSPWLTITSVGQAEHDATRKHRQYSEHTVSMRAVGDIQITIDDDGTLRYPAAIEQHWKPQL